jgi:hypothetical protein
MMTIKGILGATVRVLKNCDRDNKSKLIAISICRENRYCANASSNLAEYPQITGSLGLRKIKPKNDGNPRKADSGLAKREESKKVVSPLFTLCARRFL